MRTRPRNRLANLNRVLVFTLTLGGLLLDGSRIADVLYMLAVCLWLWMPQCTRLEAQLLQRIAREQRATHRQQTLF